MKLNIEEKNDIKIYNVYFDDLTDLYYYLKSNPEVNRSVFSKLESEKNDYDFAGDSLKKSIEYIVDGYPYNFDNFLITTERMQIATLDSNDNRELKRGIYGGIPLAPLVAAEVPDCMLRYDRRKESEIKNIYFSLGYPWHTSKEKIFNRGLATLYMIDALEKKGDIVNFVAREVSLCGNEILNIEVVLKKPTDLMLDIKKCYYPLVGREFLRRVLFRVMESTPVENDWACGYGSPLNSRELRNLFHLSKNDLIVSTPDEMGIYGENIYEDTNKLINKLKLSEEFDTEKIKKLSRF